MMKETLLIFVLLFASTVYAQPSDEQTNPIVTIGKSFLGTKYVANTLDKNDEEKLVINQKEVDCVTFVEYVLAKSLSASFTENLQKIRYRDGIIDGYTSRLHYISDWIDNGVRNGFLTDVTNENSSYRTKLSISYMSAHPKQYKQLTDSPENLEKMRNSEKLLTGKTISWLPKAYLSDAGAGWIKDGDIIAITTDVPGLDITHIGIAIYENGKLHLLHASSSLGEVVISELPISQMLNKNKSWTGIRVVRMSHPKN